MAKKEFEPIGALTLKIPLKVNGTLLKSLPYDFTRLTADELITADLNRIEETGSTAILPLIDQATNLQLFTLAVSKVMPDIDYTDIKRMSALDASKAISRAKRFFRQRRTRTGKAGKIRQTNRCSALCRPKRNSVRMERSRLPKRHC